KSSLYGPVQYKEQATADEKIISQYLTQKGLTSQFKHVKNNDTIDVYYRIIDSGLTNTLYTTSTQVTVGDTGLVLTTASRDTFYKTDQFHPTYSLGQVITGWQL